MMKCSNIWREADRVSSATGYYQVLVTVVTELRTVAADISACVMA